MKAKPFPLRRCTTGPVHVSSVCDGLAATTFCGSRVPCPVLPALPVASPITLASPWRKGQGKTLDVGQKKTCGKENRQKEWEQARKHLPSTVWQEVPSPALTLGCHHDWVSRGSANISIETACLAQGEAFQSYKSYLGKHLGETGKKHACPSWRCPRSFL